MKILKPTTVDFETDAIEKRPVYPPKPVGVSIKYWGKKARYYAFGHASNNNCTKAEAVAALAKAYETPDGVLFHNSKFDVDVAEVHCGLKPPTWHRTHDTVFLLFLDNPHSRDLGLKPNATRLLGLPPEERDEVAEWLVKRQPVPGVRISPAPKSPNSFMKFLRYAPGDLVGRYANGDTERTEGLFAVLHPDIAARGMEAAYGRERRLMPCLLDMERTGIRVDTDRLRADVAMYEEVRAKIDAWLRKRLNAGPEVNFQSPTQLLKVLEAAGVVDIAALGVTRKGNVKTDKEALAAGVADKTLSAVLRYDTQLGTCLNTFMKPWLETAELSGGLIYTTWNQTRNERDQGARTGRLSSTPNFQNMPKEFEAIFAHEEAALPKAERKGLPVCPFRVRLPPLPLCRSYIVPYKNGYVLIGRDYSQQEPRILAHFEEGSLTEQYLANPWIDYHDNAKEHLERIFARPFKRKPVKNINLGIIYGQGITSLADKNGESYADTKKLRDAIYRLYPGLKEMYSGMKVRAAAHEPFYTWGGREYYCEEPRIVEGRIMTFDYKMVNGLIQGSAADCTKEAIIRYYEVKPKNHYLHLTVHDELVPSVPRSEIVLGQYLLQTSMESVEFDVPILSEGAWSEDNWSVMQDYDKKGIVVKSNHPIFMKQRKITQRKAT